MKQKQTSTRANRRGKQNSDKIALNKETSPHKKRNQKSALFQGVSILEQISDGFFALDAQMKYIYVNARAGELLRRKPADLIGKNFWREFPEAKDSSFANAYVRALETQEPAVIEDYYAPFDRWFENRIFPSKDGLFIFFTDITERKRAEEALRQSNERFSNAFHTSPAGMVIARISDGRIIEVNEAFLDIFGYSREEVMGRTSTELNIIHPEDRTKLIQTQLATGGLRNAELASRSKSGKPVHLLFSSAPIEMEGEACFITSVLDVTARKQAEEALRLSEERFSSAFHASPAGMTITRISDGKFVDANESFCRMFEFTRDEVIGHTSTELNMWTPEERKGLIDEQTRSGGLHDFELQARAKSGRVVNILFSSKPMEIGGETHHITTMIDITERKRVEEELRLSRDRLAGLSRQLVNAHETESRAIGRELHDQIGQMLTALKITMETAISLPPEQAREKNKRGQQIVADLLDRVSRLSLELRPPMLDDLGLIPALLWHINRYQEQTNIAVEFKHSGMDGKRFDFEIETTVYRIVQESLTNVARHAHATRARLEVRLRGELLEIQIEDDGQGFDPQVALEQHRGLGGMRERVRLLGGSFQIESQIGKGTKEFIQLPLREETK